LVTLHLAYNKLGNVAVGKVLESMHQLESVSLEANGVVSIATLSLSLPRLKFLNLKNNEILKIDGLDRLPSLREIHLDKNRLRAIDRDAFAHVSQLRELYCEDNAIKIVDGLQLCVNLQKCSLATNRINELSDLARGVDGLGLVEVCFLGNPVIRKSYYRNHLIHHLSNAQTIDNRPVTQEERDRVMGSYQQDTIPPHVFTDVRTPVSSQSTAVPQPPAKASIRVMTLDDAPPLHSPTTVVGTLPSNRNRSLSKVPPPPPPSLVRTNSADNRARSTGVPPAPPSGKQANSGGSTGSFRKGAGK